MFTRHVLQVRSTLPISRIVAVEMTDKTAFKRSNVGQIILRDANKNLEIVYFQTKVKMKVTHAKNGRETLLRFK